MFICMKTNTESELAESETELGRRYAIKTCCLHLGPGFGMSVYVPRYAHGDPPGCDKNIPEFLRVFTFKVLIFLSIYLMYLKGTY